MQISGEGQSTASYNFASNSKKGILDETRYDRGSGSPTNRYDLTLELDEGTYTFYIQHGDIDITYGASRASTRGRSTGPSRTSATPTRTPASVADRRRCRERSNGPFFPMIRLTWS